MGSSRRKPSSSLKKKRSKSSSKKKSRRSKSKKLRHHSDSSSYSDDSTRISGSDLFSSSEDEYPIKDKKGSRKRSRKSSLSNRDNRRSRRRNGSKRVDDSGSKKKSSKPHKKKPGREPSISSASSKSCSCSECCRGSDSHEESKPLMRRGRLKGKVKSRGNLSRGRSETKRIRSRSPSYSPWRSPSRSPTRSSSYLGEDVTVENNSKRLRSVITVVKHEETVERERDKEEEIIYDRDDYPSRSNDSNDGGIKELVNHSEAVFDKKGLAEDKKFIDDLLDNGSTAVVEGGSRDVAMQNIGRNTTIDAEDKHINLKKSSGGMSNAVHGLGSDDLESVLRQKALENLRKFRGGVQASARSPNDQKDNSDAEVASPRHVLGQTESGKEATARVTDITKTTERRAEVGKNFTPSESIQSSQQNRMIFNGNPRRIDKVPRFGDNSERGSMVNLGGDDKEFKQCKSAFARELSQRNLIQKQESVNRKSCNILPTNNSVNTSANQSSQALETTTKEDVRGLELASSLTHPSMKQPHTLPEKPKTVLTKNMVNKNADQSSQAKPLSCDSLAEEANNNSVAAAAMPPSSSKSDQIEQTSSGQKDETKEGSQFQQKTMSVMRGGEMVQVSYKVYIPKKAPALARRKLQR